MFSGYKTYITVAVMVIFNILQQMGMTGIEQPAIEAAINVILGIGAFLFNFFGRKKIAK
jgi:hypothetical protein